MQNLKKCSVFIWEEKIGELAIVNNSVFFKYDPGFKGKYTISPKLPYSLSQYNFSSYEHQLSGVFADSIPDGIGMQALERYFSENYPDFYPNIIDKLCFIGDSSVGALSYQPAYGEKESGSIAISLRELKQGQKDILEKRGSYHSVREMAALYRAISPVNGARDKAFVNYNKQTNSFSIGANIRQDTPLMLKLQEKNQPYFTRLEYIYSCCAEKFKINMPKTYLFKDGDEYHYGIERFDKDNFNNKKHVVSLAGLLDERKSKRIDYMNFLSFAKKELGVEQSGIDEIYRRMVFNLLFANNDDHLKNHSFIMDKKGKWDVSPAYDIVFTSSIGERVLKLNINNKKSDGVSIKDLEHVADVFGVNGLESMLLDACDVKDYLYEQLDNYFADTEMDAIIEDVKNAVDKQVDKIVKARAGFDMNSDVEKMSDSERESAVKGLANESDRELNLK